MVWCRPGVRFREGSEVPVWRRPGVRKVPEVLVQAKASEALEWSGAGQV